MICTVRHTEMADNKKEDVRGKEKMWRYQKVSGQQGHVPRVPKKHPSTVTLLSQPSELGGQAAEETSLSENAGQGRELETKPFGPCC